jgi:hypothetical protein
MSAFHGLSAGKTRRDPSAGLVTESGVVPGGSVSELSDAEHAASSTSATGAAIRSMFGMGWLSYG